MAVKPTVQRKMAGSAEKKHSKKVKQRTSGPAMSLRQKQAVIEQLRSTQQPTEVAVAVERVDGLAMKIAKAADAESLWEKDVVRFPDLVEKYELGGWVVEDVRDAQRINQNRMKKLDKLFDQIRRNYYGMDQHDQVSNVKKRSRMPEFYVAVKPVATAKMKVGRKFVAAS